MKENILIQFNISIYSDAPRIEYGNQRTVVPSRGVWNAEQMPFLMPQNGMSYTILNTNGRTGRNELNELAEMVRTHSFSKNDNFRIIHLL